MTCLGGSSAVEPTTSKARPYGHEWRNWRNRLPSCSSRRKNGPRQQRMFAKKPSSMQRLRKRSLNCRESLLRLIRGRLRKPPTVNAVLQKQRRPVLSGCECSTALISGTSGKRWASKAETSPRAHGMRKVSVPRSPGVATFKFPSGAVLLGASSMDLSPRIRRLWFSKLWRP